MPSLDWNLAYWGAEYEWPHGGEEWSEAWGGSYTQWWAVIAPRIASSLPASAILEIAPGHGRWTRFLLPGATRFRGYDISQPCVTKCEELFQSEYPDKDIQFHKNDGMTLEFEVEETIDFIFSFDSLVHAEMAVMRSYLREIGRVLAPNGRAFLHHSNLGMFGGHASSYAHERGSDVSAETIRQSAQQFGLSVPVQEMVNWKTKECIDCFTLLEKNQSTSVGSILYNDSFWSNSAHIKSSIAPYNATRGHGSGVV